MVEEARRFTLAGLLAFMFLVAGTFLFRTGHVYSWSVLFPGWLLSLLSVPAGRALARCLLIRLGGLTGFWQVNGRSEAGLDGREALDTYYIRRSSTVTSTL